MSVLLTVVRRLSAFIAGLVFPFVLLTGLVATDFVLSFVLLTGLFLGVVFFVVSILAVVTGLVASFVLLTGLFLGVVFFGCFCFSRCD